MMHHSEIQPAFRKAGVRLLPLLLLAVVCLGFTTQGGASTQAAPLGLPSGFKAEVYATGLTTPRFVSFSPDGDLYVAEFGSTNNSVKALPDHNHDGKPDKVVTFASGFYSPNNVAFHAGAVYVGELVRIDRLVDT